MFSIKKTALLITVVLAMGFTATTKAQSNQTFVASYGNDTYSCTRPSPCRSFAVALTKTAAGGEIIAIDSAVYEAFVINKSVSITAGNGYVGIRKTTPNGAAIAVAAGSTDNIILRGLTLLGSGTSTIGIHYQSAGSLHVENCVIKGFSNWSGIRLDGHGVLTVKDSSITNCSGGIRIKVYLTKIIIDNCRIENNGYGILIEDVQTSVTVRDSLIANNGTGVDAWKDSKVSIENCLFTTNTTAISSHSPVTYPGSKVYVSGSTFTFNTTVLSKVSPSAIYSFGNNKFIGNTTDGEFTSTITQK